MTFADRMRERARKCAVCGHEWLKSSVRAPDPRRCPNHECRSTKWRGDKEENGDHIQHFKELIHE